ncbi:GNAT family N-acetyltransferase KABA2_13S00704 [Maudiozyma barnettii]|uniref:N-acetyltransferase domain-containing protein n=1 Tax=Maudiozyma barnettii TaxID=61262 RepID=A0A8H2ZJY3_9SACH|nr:uncharacterized protein KABA2_13S00704 [Kazachstania barnettii]CAB4256997.1 similar to Saccharomyces cerevisiae YIR042C Putative protein of unknown function [Kazachstania barnettii]
MTVNAYNQQIDDEVPNWSSRSLPERVTITGKTCILEPLDLEKHSKDLLDAFNLMEDDRTWTYQPFGPFTDLQEYKNAWSTLQEGTQDIHFAVIDINTKKPVGQLAIKHPDHINGIAEAGYVTFSPLLQRTRMSTEAHYLLARYIFDTLKYRRYQWQCFVHNVPSRVAAERLGFQFEGTLRQTAVIKGRNKSAHWFSIIDSEWDICREAMEKWLDDSNFDEDGRQKFRLQEIRESLLA